MSRYLIAVAIVFLLSISGASEKPQNKYPPLNAEEDTKLELFSLRMDSAKDLSDDDLELLRAALRSYSSRTGFRYPEGVIEELKEFFETKLLHNTELHQCLRASLRKRTVVHTKKLRTLRAKLNRMGGVSGWPYNTLDDEMIGSAATGSRWTDDNAQSREPITENTISQWEQHAYFLKRNIPRMIRVFEQHTSEQK